MDPDDRTTQQPSADDTERHSGGAGDTAPRLVNFTQLGAVLRDFAAERDWEQFHTPKNLSMAVAGEAGELLEIFQWLTTDESLQLNGDQQRHVGEELADIVIYAVRLASVLGLDLGAAIGAKIDSNASRYPADQVRGTAVKYSHRQTQQGEP